MTTPAAQRQLRLMTWFLIAMSTVVVASIVVGGVVRSEPGLIAAGPTSTTSVPTTEQPVDPTTTVPATSTSAAPLAPRLVVQTEADIAASVAPKVAFITTLNGSGSGVLVDEGLVVTNAHVIWPFRDVGVLFPGDTRRGGTVIGINPRADLALIRVKSPRLPEPVEFGDTASLDAGSTVFIVGYPGVDDFTPDPTVVPASYREVVSWAFSGVSWAISDAPAIGGQSGGALLDEYGRLIGITTFGSAAELYSVRMEDLEQIIDNLRDGAEETVDERLPPRRGGRLEFTVELGGPWEQAAFVTWLNPGTVSELTSSRALGWRALDAFGFQLASGIGELEVFWPSATPGIVLARSDDVGTFDVTVNRPLVRIEDPDDGQRIVIGDEPALAGGFVDVAGDRDWWLVDLDEDVESLQVAVQAQTRVRITVYDRTSRLPLEQVDHERGFLFTDPILETGPLTAGSYVISVEDIAFQFGTYSLEVSG